MKDARHIKEAIRAPSDDLNPVHTTIEIEYGQEGWRMADGASQATEEAHA